MAPMTLPMLRGRWTDDESLVHTDALELHAVKLTLLALAPNVSHSHIRLMLDNTTDAAYIDKMGGGGACTPPVAMRLLCLYGIVQRTETFGCLPCHTVADFHSLNFRDNTEWMLNPVVFKQLSALCFVPEVDLFASRLNCQFTPFSVVETGTWGVGSECLLPLLSSFMFSLPLASWEEDGGTGMLVTPFWSTQPWFPQLLELLIDHPRLLQPKQDLQRNGRLDMVHPLHSKLALLVTIISGQPSKVQAYQQRLQPSFVMPGEREPNSNTTAHCVDWESSVVHGKSIPLLLL